MVLNLKLGVQSQNMLCRLSFCLSLGCSGQGPLKKLQPLFPTCQVRVVRFYQSCSPPPPPHPPPPSPPRPPPRSPDPNREFQIAVGTAGPQPRLPDRSGHCRTSTATSRSQWALPDLDRDFQIAVGSAGPQPRAPDPSGHCRTSTAR